MTQAVGKYVRIHLPGSGRIFPGTVLVNRRKPDPKQEDQLVCYGVEARASDATKPEFVISTDPEDPIFYSSCYVRERNIQWVAPVVPPPPPPLPRSHFSNKCLECASFERNRQPASSAMVPPVWTLNERCTSCNGNGSSIDLVGENDTDASCATTTTTSSTRTTTTTYTGTTQEPPEITTTTTTTIYDAANVDCVEQQAECSAACERARQRNHTVLVPHEKKGKACTGATDCRPGDGQCPATTSVGNVWVEGSAASYGGGGAATAVPIVLCLLIAVGVAFRKRIGGEIALRRGRGGGGDVGGISTTVTTVTNQIYDDSYRAEAEADGDDVEQNAAVVAIPPPTPPPPSTPPPAPAPATPAPTHARVVLELPSELISDEIGNDDDRLGLLDTYEI